MRIGVLTGGGDVPGLNSVIKSVVYRSTAAGNEVLGIRKGWQGLTHVRLGPTPDPEYILPLDRENTRNIDRAGGTMLHTSRTNPKRMREERLPELITARDRERLRQPDGTYDLTPIVIANLQRLGIERLVVIGGDDTISFARVLSDQGFPQIAIPKTMDNDVQGTEYCVGFSTAITRAKELVDRQRTTLGSHERIGIFRIFGRDAGFSALHTAYVTSGRCLIPEAPFDLDHLIDVLVEDKRSNPSHYAFVIAAEGAKWTGLTLGEVGEPDAYGHRKKQDVADALADQIHHRTGEDVIVSQLTYDLRSGNPDAFDQMVATTFANIAVDLLEAGVSGQMVAVQHGTYTHTDLPDPALGARTVDVERQYDLDRFRPRYTARLGYSLFLEGTPTD
ncbi:MAG: 6-phosphofructokinase [Chloroflexota bacterium]|nr:6-phosphofructokinase [Chloroflexota bacterium]MDE3102926.1 6-phosphofructokinase [Chloroflexota bacterium]